MPMMVVSPSTGTRAFGSVSVYGRSLRPAPAARTNPIMGWISYRGGTRGDPARITERVPQAGRPEASENSTETARKLMSMTAEQLISFARGAPSLDIIDVEGLKAAAARAFDADPAGMTAYGTSVG